MKKNYIITISILLLQLNLFAQNQIWINAGYGRYLVNSENSLKVLEDDEIDNFVNFGFGYQREKLFGFPISFEYNYFQNTEKNVIRSIWTDATGMHLGEITGDYKLINHTFDLDYLYNMDDNFTFGIGPTFIITNRILDIDLSEISNLELYDKLASS